MLLRDGALLELDFNRLSEVPWPAVEQLAEAGVKVRQDRATQRLCIYIDTKISSSR